MFVLGMQKTIKIYVWVMSGMVFLHTGDIGKYDKDGYLYITGRNNRYIKMFGKRINLDEVEHQLTLHLKREVFVSAETEKILIISVEKLGHQLVDWCAKTFHLPQRAFEIIKREKNTKKKQWEGGLWEIIMRNEMKWQSMLIAKFVCIRN